jgi:hypothetical protein
MVKPELVEKYNQQINEIYRAIGECVVRFEHVAEAIRGRIREFEGKLNLGDLDLGHLQFGDLIRELKKTYSSQGNEQHPDFLLEKILYQDLRDLNDERHRVIHNVWFVGWASEHDTDFSEFTAMHPGNKKQNKKAHFIEKQNAQTFQNLTQKCEILYRVLYTYCGIVADQYGGPNFSDVWRREKNGDWIRKI